MFALAAKRLSAVAHRMRLHRARRCAGLRCATLEVREAEIAALVRKGMLCADSQNDDRPIRDALYSHLDRSLSNGL